MYMKYASLVNVTKFQSSKVGTNRQKSTFFKGQKWNLHEKLYMFVSQRFCNLGLQSAFLFLDSFWQGLMTVHQSRNLTSKRLTVEHSKSIFDSQKGAEAFRVDGLVKPKFAKDFISVLKLSASQIFFELWRACQVWVPQIWTSNAGFEGFFWGYSSIF